MSVEVMNMTEQRDEKEECKNPEVFYHLWGCLVIGMVLFGMKKVLPRRVYIRLLACSYKSSA